MHKPTKRQTLSTLLLLSTMLTLLMWPATSSGQTQCAEPNRCLSPERANALIDAGCRRARTAELRLTDEVLPDLAAVQAQRDSCHGRLAQVQETPVVPWRPPLWIRLALDVGIGASAGATGAVAAVGGAPELIVGLAVGSVAVLVGRIVLEVLK